LRFELQRGLKTDFRNRSVWTAGQGAIGGHAACAPNQYRDLIGCNCPTMRDDPLALAFPY
jgi:hypothetical protein